MSSPILDEKPLLASRTLHEWHSFLQRRGWSRGWNRRNWKRKLVRLLRTAPVNELHTAWSYADRYASLVAAWTGLSRTAQLWQMTLLALRYGIPPEEYYSYKLYRPERFRKAGRYIRHAPKVKLNDYLINLSRSRERFNMRDKRVWFVWAHEHDVPTSCALASFEEGTMTPWAWDGNLSDLPPTDLFSIWVDMYRGEGAECWIYEDGHYAGIRHSSLRLTAEELIEHLTKQSKERPVMLLERVRNHPEMQGYTSGGLATIRLVTGRFPHGAPQPLIANLKMPRGQAIVDDLSAGNLAAPIDLEDGTLGPAVSAFPEPAGDMFHIHPDTGARITGSVFPFWRDVVDLAISTHQKLPDEPFVGWDITVSEDGPVIIEPNDGWGASTTEKPGGIALRDTAYEAMYDAWIRYLQATANRTA